MQEYWKKSHLPEHQIFLFSDAIPHEMCDRLVKVIDESKTRKERYGPGSNVYGEIMSPLDAKDKWDGLDDEIYNIVNEVVNRICYHSRDILVKGDTGYQLRRIERATRRHVDGVIVPDDNTFILMEKTNELPKMRIMSVIFALNDNYEGGELCFPEQNVKIKLKKGQAIAFPPYWTHPHYTTDLLNNTVRYTINTWLHQ